MIREQFIAHFKAYANADARSAMGVKRDDSSRVCFELDLRRTPGA